MGKSEQELKDLESQLNKKAKDLEANQKNLNSEVQEFKEFQKSENEAFAKKVTDSRKEFDEYMVKQEHQLRENSKAGTISSPTSVFKSGPSKEEIATRAKKAEQEAKKVELEAAKKN